MPRTVIDLSLRPEAAKIKPKRDCLFPVFFLFEMDSKKPFFSHVIEIFKFDPQEKGRPMSGKAAKIIVTEKQHAILEQIANARTAPRQLIQRAKIILLAFGGRLNMQIPDQVGCSLAGETAIVLSCDRTSLIEPHDS